MTNAALAAVSPRFWNKFQKSSGCWLWIGMKTKAGYGQIDARKTHGIVVYAHRLSWFIHNGPIPRKKEVLHKCDNPTCVNPKHLSIGTHAENMADMARKGRSASKDLNGRRKLDSATARIIRESLLTDAALSKTFGVSRTTIWRVRTGAAIGGWNG